MRIFKDKVTPLISTGFILFLSILLSANTASATMTADPPPIVPPPQVILLDMYMTGDEAPTRIDTDEEGRLYITYPGGSRVDVYSNTGTELYSLDNRTSGIISPLGIAVDEQGGRIFISDKSALNS